MMLRSGGKKLIFNAVPSPLAKSSPVLSVHEQREEQETQKNKIKMEESVDALSRCCRVAQAKVTRIRRVIELANVDHRKFSVHALSLYLKTTDSAYDEFNDFHNRICLADPAKAGEFEPVFLEFEELYEFTRIALCEMLQAYEDEKTAADKAIAVAGRGSSGSTQPGSSGMNFPMAFPQTIVLQQTALPVFDGRYENWFKFKQMFCDIADKCTADSAATKLHYLDKALIGKAHGAIDQQIIRDNDYEGAWRSLTEQFENLPALINETIARLLNLKPMTLESFSQLKTLTDDVEKCVSSLAYHDLKMDKLSEAMITNLTASRLDENTRKVWESSVKRKSLPSYKDMIAVLRNQQSVLERCEKAKPAQKNRYQNPMSRSENYSGSSKAHTSTVGKTDDSCLVCDENHDIESCEMFRKLNVNARYNRARQIGLCFTCLKKGHRTADCNSEKKCSMCSRTHNVLLHPEDKKSQNKDMNINEESTKRVDIPTPTATTCTVSCSSSETTTQILLATAIVDVLDVNGLEHKCRVLLDSGAMANFMSQRFVDLLSLKRKSANVPVVGVNGMKTLVKFKVHAKVRSRTSNHTFCLDYLIVPKVTGTLPTARVEIQNWPIPHNLALADPYFHEPSRIDLLIGAEMFYDLLYQDKINMSVDLPVLQDSSLGWLVSGRVADLKLISTVRMCHAVSKESSKQELTEMLKRFWLIDEQSHSVLDQGEDEECERHFIQTHQRSESGRYTVRLPFRESIGELGDSKAVAEKRFTQLERRFDRNPIMKQQYKAFIDEYIALGHARIIDEKCDDESKGYFLPHHCVLKPESSTTKLRVVFDASSMSSTNLSLNDVMMTGPTVQPTLFDIVLRFRIPKYVFTADVSKMYRQVQVHKDDCKYQKILWRDDRTEPLRTIELQTVTYGTSAAPFLATRSLNQLAIDEQMNYPEASSKALKSFYVDDVLTGSDDLEEAKKLQRDLTEMLMRGGFELRKWCANNAAILDEIPVEFCEKQLDFENHDVNGVIKTLGLLWNPVDDVFVFHAKPMDDSFKSFTKRQIMSEIARLFDPLGLLAPVVVIGKLVMQQLWKEEINWDDIVSGEPLNVWRKFRSELCAISELKIPRNVTVSGTAQHEIHGFADASMKAYGSCIYLRSVRKDGSAELRLLCGKSRVAPLKELKRKQKGESDPTKMTIPRLELCAANLLAEQVTKVMPAIDVTISDTVLWSDSKIVLSWIANLKPESPIFVCNRISNIRQLTCTYKWNYVPTTMNPADLISRGIYPATLTSTDLWWRGPNFLHTYEAKPSYYNHEIPMEVESGELLKMGSSTLMVATAVSENDLTSVISRYSDFRKLERVFAYVARFVHNCRRPADQRRGGGLTIKEFRESQLSLIRAVQLTEFKDEINCILKGLPVSGTLRNINPIFDKDLRLLKVGGRLRFSNLSIDQKHPLILPERHHLTELLIITLHRENLHVGLNGLLAILRQKYWPVKAKRCISRILKRCVRCFRVNPRNVQQFMGDLPSCRVTPALPFMRTGVDYAGPVFLKQGRSKAPLKGYIALFVCMTTKALHLELVSSLSTDTFLGALHRFVGRRGNVSEIFSDNGKNFVGAERQLKELRQLLSSQSLKMKIDSFCQVREAHLTYEEMSTLLVQIEAILNSRPLCPQSDDPLDYDALSPAHFLIGRELTAIAEPFYTELAENRLSRYQLVQKYKQCFWRRWSNEYITTLQIRGKWNKTPTAIRNDLLVILKEDDAPPMTWQLGRIIEVYPGNDGIIRVVKVRTSRGNYVRPTTKIAILPIEDND
ncbi:uncharacterized protein LOC131428978 [Malaya genurostris]|uniref:uncharacterized protein LOC131428978 n=1 Tax=Malaya genurostris TaxID=325434 RepID=UPI0026F3E970|nr:uncharacterized protein LOC131428978 [Malaya genurostris]